MDDSVCTACHQDLRGHQEPGAGPLTAAAVVTRFDRDHHPEFTPPAGVPGPGARRIKFNHALHLTAGLTRENGAVPFTYGNLPATDRARYGGAKSRDLKSPVQLECRACHQLDGEEYARGYEPFPARMVPPRTPGAVMLPVTYESHCRACHPLHFDKNLPGQSVRHGVSPRELVQDLERFYGAEAIRADPALLRRFVPPRPVPGRPAPAEVTRAGQAAWDKVLSAIKLLFGTVLDEGVRKREGLPAGQRGCLECHELKTPVQPLTSARAAAELQLEPVVVRSIWFERARFDHTAHRALRCETCHAGAPDSKDNQTLLLPGIAQCTGCHAPPSTRAGRSSGGAGMACTECHRYHNGDHPFQGVGAAARRGAAELSLERFLNGGTDSRGK
jgi:hypothetical protein